MTEPIERTTALIVKLNRLTSLDQLAWRVDDPPRAISRGTDDVIPFFLTARYKNQRFGLYQHRYQQYDGESDRFYWNERLVLAILDIQDRVLWETNSQLSALLDLFETARRKVANVDGIIDDLLKEGDA
jgi:hypothetical protein